MSAFLTESLAGRVLFAIPKKGPLAFLSPFSTTPT